MTYQPAKGDHHVEAFIEDASLGTSTRTFGWQCFDGCGERGPFVSFDEAFADADRHHAALARAGKPVKP